jgi:tripartite-type tricarboxylate transporter receptor subunit TctC
MTKITKFLSTIFTSLAVASAAAAADRVEIVNYYPPGGGTDFIARIIQQQLSQQDVDVTVRYVRSCSDALRYLSRNPSSFVLGITTDFNPKGRGKCIMDADTDGINLYSSASTAPVYFCTSPGRDISEEELRTTPLRVGISTDDVLPFYFRHFLANANGFNNNITVVPYSGAGGIIRAAVAGDIDLWFGAGTAGRLIQEGAKCFAATTKDNPQNYPFIGSLTVQGDEFPELPQHYLLWTRAPVGEQVTEKFIKMFTSREYADAIEPRFFTHNGIGVGVTGSEELRQLVELDGIFQTLR